VWRVWNWITIMTEWNFKAAVNAVQISLKVAINMKVYPVGFGFD
jgi:hypothetical protein